MLLFTDAFQRARWELKNQKALAGFERAAVDECFALPKEVEEAGSTSAAAGASEAGGQQGKERFSEEYEAELSAELAALRQRIAAAHAACAGKRRKAERVEAELKAYAEKGTSLHEVAGVGKENFARLQEDTSAVVQAADKLIPLLERSCELGADVGKAGAFAPAGSSKAGRMLPPRGLSGARSGNVGSGAALEGDFARRQRALGGASAAGLEALNTRLTAQ